jgi:hypothetical protein
MHITPLNFQPRLAKARDGLTTLIMFGAWLIQVNVRGDPSSDISSKSPGQ